MSDLKKKTWKYVLSVLIFTLFVCVADIQPAQAAVKLNASSMNLCVGERTKLKLTGTTKKAKWKSSKPTVVKVSSAGTVAAKSAGSATVTATVGSKSYSCKFNVNKNFKIDTTSISIKKNTDVTAFLSVNGSINASVADKKICSVTFGKWDGDYMPLTIVPKKVGSTTITFRSVVNNTVKETCTLKVKVTALPVTATIQNPSINTGADVFIAGENMMNFTFQVNRSAQNVSLRIYNTSGDIVRRFDIGALAAKKTTSILWDGLDADGIPMDGTYKYAVVADGTKTSGGSGKVYAASPFGKGDGTESNPFLVSDLDELLLIKSFNGAHFVQDAEIDFNYGSIAPLFDDATPFTGTYDGKNGTTNYWMTNLYGYNSVFGTIATEGSIRNVSMNNCVLNTTGSLLAYTNYGTIDNCNIHGNILCSAGGQAAMLVMYNKGQIRNCSAFGNLTVVTSDVVASTTLRAGGIAMNNTGMIAECTSSVQLKQQMFISTYVPTCTYEIYTGGIVAENAVGAFVTQCRFAGEIDAQVVLPDAVKDVEGIEAGKIYSGYVSGSSYGYTSKCVNVGSGAELSAQGTGTGVVQ